MEKPKEENAAKDDVESNTRLSNNNSQGLVSVQSEATSGRSSRAIRVRVRTRRRIRRRRDRVTNNNNNNNNNSNSNSNIEDDRNSGDRTSSLSSGRISAFRRFFPIRFVDSDSESRNEDSRLNGLPVAYPIQPTRNRNRNRSRNRIRTFIRPISIRRISSGNENSNEREAQHADEENNNDYKKWCANYTVIYSFIGALCAIVVLLQVISSSSSSSSKKHPVIEEDGYKEGNLQNLRFDNSSNVTTNDEKIEPLVKDNFTCYTDPMVINSKELEMFENGEDPSIPRTYHLCPNTNFYPYELDSGKFLKFDYTSGMHFPLTLFRSNVSILCGLDGALENNCTFHGGLSSIWIRAKIPRYNYRVDTIAENITVSGMTFTEGSLGSTVFVANITGSLTIRDCYFHNNHGLSQSIGVHNINDSEQFSITVENSTFENNTYSYLGTGFTTFNDFNLQEKRFVAYIGVLYVVSAVPQIRVSNSRFLNNHFEDFDENSSTTEQKEEGGEVLSGSSAVINILRQITDSNHSNIFEETDASLEVSNSHFVGNTGYSSTLFNIEANNTSLGGSENESIQLDMIYYNVQENLIMNNTPSNI